MDRNEQGRRFKEALEDINMSPREFAREYDLSERAVLYWCSGERPIPVWALKAIEQIKDETVPHDVNGRKGAQHQSQSKSLIQTALVDLVDDKNQEDHESIVIAESEDFDFKTAKAIFDEIERKKKQYADDDRDALSENSNGALTFKWFPVPDHKGMFMLVVFRN